MIIELNGGYSRVKSPHLLSKGDFSKLQNFISRDGGIKKVGGTVAYNTSLGSLGIPWALRSYHIQASSDIVKRTHCFYDGKIYYGNDVTGALNPTNMTNLTKKTIPLSFTFQEADNSITYFLTGKDRIKKYDGNAAHKWDEAGGDLASIYDYEDGAVHLDRVFYVKYRSSQLDYSDALAPQTIADTITVGQDRDSYNVRAVVGANETLYIFKNNSIWQLYGRTASQFQLRLVTDKYGLAAKRGIYPVANGFVFLNTFDKELYTFGGSESSIRPLTEDDIRLREIMNHTPQALENVCMTVYDGLFRFAFQHTEAIIDANNCELVYSIHNPNANSLPKWSLLRGTNVWCYSNWDKEGDRQLVTGRSDVGKLMYHNRGNNFDTEKIESQVRTGSVTLSENMVCRIGDILIKAHPGSYNTKSLFRYYLNERNSDRGEADLSLAGETRTVGLIHLQTQTLLNDRIIPLHEYSIGNDIAFEIYDNNLDTQLELYSISVDAYEKYKIRNQFVGTQT